MRVNTNRSQGNLLGKYKDISNVVKLSFLCDLCVPYGKILNHKVHKGHKYNANNHLSESEIATSGVSSDEVKVEVLAPSTLVVLEPPDFESAEGFGQPATTATRNTSIKQTVINFFMGVEPFQFQFTFLDTIIGVLLLY